jgi:PAS domain S-box-containing protein
MAGKASGWHEAAIDGTGKTHVYGYVPLDGPPQDIFVLYGIEKDAALAPIADATMRGLLLIVLGIALSGVLALWMTERFIERPVAGLIATIERWLAGSYAERATIPGRHTEIGRLAAAFNNLAETVSIRERALQRSEGELRAIFEFAGRGKVLTDPATGRFLRVNRAFCEMLGYTPEELLERTVADVTHPEHHEEDAAAFARLARGEMAAFDREKRYVTKTGEVIWVRANLVVLRDAAGGAVYAVSVIEDITARRAEAERMKLLSAEVDHRAKNMLATVLAITRMTRADSAKAMTDTLAGRFQTLARAHTLLSESHWKGADLKRLLSDELSAYVQAGRVAISGPTIALQPQMAQSLAMTAHELATNAAKYGALSSPAGRVTIAWTWEGKNRFALEWQEARGPAVQAPERQGFGTSLISTMVERQLGGSVVFDWRPEGLACRMVIPMDERG